MTMSLDQIKLLFGGLINREDLHFVAAERNPLEPQEVIWTWLECCIAKRLGMPPIMSPGSFCFTRLPVATTLDLDHFGVFF